jgi:chromosome segregation ATPase
VISEPHHLEVVAQVKLFFKGHMDKLKTLITHKQTKINSLEKLVENLQKKLQFLSVELENQRCDMAEKNAKFSKVQQEAQQLKIEKLVLQDDTSNFQREIGIICFVWE